MAVASGNSGKAVAQTSATCTGVSTCACRHIQELVRVRLYSSQMQPWSCDMLHAASILISHAALMVRANISRTRLHRDKVNHEGIRYILPLHICLQLSSKVGGLDAGEPARRV